MLWIQISAAGSWFSRLCLHPSRNHNVPSPQHPRNPHSDGHIGGKMPYRDADHRFRALAGRDAIGGLHGCNTLILQKRALNKIC
jgi:hypothetical protein